MITAKIEYVVNNTAKFGQETRKRASQVVKRAALQCEGLAKVNAPVDTGALRNSIQAKPVDDLTWEVGVGVDYALFVEMGTSKMAAQPYMTPAAEAVRPQFLGEMRDIFE